MGQLTNAGIAFCYVGNYDTEKTNTGRVKNNIIQVGADNSPDSSYFLIKGSSKNYSEYIGTYVGFYYKACKNLFIHCYNSSGGDLVDLNSLTSIYRVSLNENSEESNYNNPCILNCVETFKALTNVDIYAIKLRVISSADQGSSEGTINVALVEQSLPSSITLNTGDTVTFSITVK